MQGQARFGGPIGAFTEPTTNQQHQANVWGTYSYSSAYDGDPAELERSLSMAIISGVQQVVQSKLWQGQLAVPTIAPSLPALIPEIVTAANVGTLGAQVQILDINIQLTGAEPGAAAPPPPDPMQSAQNAMARAAQNQAEAMDPRNHEYEARINVGGFKLKASTDQGFDADGLADQIKDKAKSNLIWYGIGCFILLLVLIGLAGLAWYVYSTYQASTAPGGPARATGSADAVRWDGQSPYHCGLGKNVKISGVTATLKSGTAITAAAGCQVTLENVTISAPIALSAMANAKITVKGGSITGTQFAAKALGQGAEIAFEGTKVDGKTSAIGGGTITGL